MVFVPPSWIEGLLINLGMYIGIPLFLALIAGIGIGKLTDDGEIGFGSFIVVFIVAFLVMIPVTSVYWFNNYEVPSVQEKIITVQDWEPVPGISTDSNGMMTIDNANQLMLVTTDNECFVNDENLYFNKFNTRDIFNKMKVGGTYKIKYYGWRCGYTSSFPNILSVEQVVNETNATPTKYSDYFGTKLA